MSTPYQITIVSHTHWDREWYRPFQVFRMQLVDLIDMLLDMLENDPDYRSFLLDGQTIVLEDYLEMRPRREKDLRRYVREGRLLIGPWHILPDEFLVSAESTVRNLMLGARIASDFGGRMQVGYTPDPFGHIGQLPQIMAGVGIDVLMLQRGIDDRPAELWWEAPDGTRQLLIFLRAGYGNLAWAPTTAGAFARAVELQIERIKPFIRTPHIIMLNGTDHMMPQPELPALIREANSLLEGKAHIRHGSLPEYIAAVRATLGTDELPIIQGEQRSPQLFPVLPGVYSARMWIKQRNFACEHLLTGYAEPLHAFGRLLDGPERTGELWRAWRYLIENHPHDSICGCSIDAVHEEMRTRFDWAEQIGQTLAAGSLRYLAGRIDGRALPLREVPVPGAPPTHAVVSEEGDNAVIVYNPTAGSRSERVEVAVPWAGAGRHYELLDENGRSVSCVWPGQRDVVDEQRTLGPGELPPLLDQIEIGFYRGRLIRDVRVWIDRENSRAQLEMVLPEYHTGEIGNFHELVRALRGDAALRDMQQVQLITYLSGPRKLRFVAQDVPGVGYRAYRLQPMPGPVPAGQTGGSDAGDEIENEWFRVRVSRDDGTLTITDKTTGRTYSGLNRFVDGGDRGDEYNYCPPAADLPVTAPTAVHVVERYDDGPLGQRLRISMTYRVPACLAEGRAARSAEMVDMPITSEVQLTPGLRRVDIHSSVENRAEDHRLRVLFPTGIHSREAVVDGHFDRLKRVFEAGDAAGWAEQPQPTSHQGAFTAVQDGRQGLMVAVRGLPEYELISDKEGATLAVTLLRCVGWLSRDDLANRPGHAGPELATPGAQCPGRHDFVYSLIPFGDDLDEAARRAYAFAEPLLAGSVRIHEGTLPPAHTLLALEPAALVLSTIKAAEDGGGLIVRFYNSSEQAVSGSLRCGFAVRSATPSNLLEEPAGTALVPAAEGDFTRFALEVPAKRIVTLRLEL